LDLIDETLDSDERVHTDVRALLFDPGQGLKMREAEGHLVLTDRRLIFGPSQHGIMVDLGRNEIRTPVTVRFGWMRARLGVEASAGDKYTFVVNKSAAHGMALILNKAARG
jgi:hypothetical protein